MARDNGFTQDDDNLFRSGKRPPREPAGELDDDSPRVLDLEPEEESPFLRAQKRVPVRRGSLPRKAANRLKQAAAVLAALGALAIASGVVYRYATRAWRFRIDSGQNIEITGAQNVSRRQVLHAVGADIGRNIFLVPLAERRHQLEEIPWVESAAVMRLLPDRLRVHIQERTPAAFVRLGSKVALIDAHGAIMELPSGKARKYSFPVILGTSLGEPLSTRAPRMRIYSDLVRELDSEGARYSQDLSEVDLSDPEDVKVVVADPQGAVLLHLGVSDFLARYKTYLAHAAEWRQQFQKLESVDLRYDRQIIVNPDPAVQRTSSPPPIAKPAPAPPQQKQAVVKKPAPPARKPSPRTKPASST